jgi:hypothetical protein
MINAMTIIKKKNEMTYTDFQNYWKNEHGIIVTRSSHIGTYIQSHPIYNANLDFEDSIDGLAEIWFKDTEAMRNLASTAEYKDIQADEKVFIDSSAISLLIAEDTVLKEGKCTENKILLFVRKKPTLSLEKFRDICLESDIPGLDQKYSRCKISLPKISGYNNGKIPAWDAIFSLWQNPNEEVNQVNIESIRRSFTDIANKTIGKFCSPIVIQEV